MNKAVQAQALTKQYRDLTAVDRLDLTIYEGELFALLGVNGAGKSTTIKMLSCLSRPTSGDASIFGYSISTQAQAVKELIAISPQETAVAPNLSICENWELICGIHGFSREKTAQKIAELSELLQIPASMLSKKAGKLSGGWQRRVSIAMALISEPRLLFLDEPTLGLDVLARSELWKTISALKGRMTVILTTHYMEEAEQLSDRIGVMKDGKLLALGSAEELMKRTGENRFENAFIKLVREGGAV